MADAVTGSLTTADFAIECAFRIDVLTLDMHLISKSSNTIEYSIRLDAADTDILKLDLFQSDDTDRTLSIVTSLSAAGVAADSEWHWLSIVMDHSGTALLTCNIDNVATTSTDVSTWSGVWRNDVLSRFCVGDSKQDGTKSWNGGVDELAIFLKALSDADRTNTYNWWKFNASSDTTPVPSGTITNPQDYVARWELESNTTAPDSTYRGHDGTVNGSPVAVSAGVIGNALTFDGIDDYIRITNHLDLRPTVFGICAWVKTSVTGVQWIAGNYDSTGNTFAGISLYEIGTGKAALYVAKDTGNTENSHWYKTVSTTSIDDGDWHHIIGVHSGTTSKIYIDGVLEATRTTLSVVHGATDFIIGRREDVQSSVSYYFNGSIDDVRLYSRALSATEVDGIFQSRIIAPPEDFVAEWNLESDGTESLGNHPATLVASPTFGAGWEGNAMTLNGSTQYGTVAQHADLRPVNVTIAGWVNTTDTSNQMSVFSNSEIQTPYSGFQLRVDSGKPRLGIFSHTGHTVGVDYQVIASTSSVNDGDWHHIAATYDGADLKIYVNGVLEGTQAYANGIGYDVLDTIGIGVHKAGGTFSQYFNGSIDKLQVFSRALTDAEITAMYNVTLTGITSSPIVYYSMNDTDISDPTIDDTSGSTNVHNATLVNTPITGVSGKLGEAIDLNGIDGHATVVDHADFKQSSVSISLWLQTDDNGEIGLIQSYSEFSSVKAGWIVWMSAGKIYFTIGANTGTVLATDYDQAVSVLSVNDNLFHAVTATYDGTTINIYVDGVLDGTKTFTATLGYHATNYIRLGCRNKLGVNEAFYDGVLDQVKVYISVLTNTEVTDNYDSDSPTVISQSLGFKGVWDDAAFWDRALLPYDRRNFYQLWSTSSAAEGLESEWRDSFVGKSEILWDTDMEDQHYYDFSIATRNRRGIHSDPVLLLGKQVKAADNGPDQLGSITGFYVAGGSEMTVSATDVYNSDIANIIWAVSPVNDRNDGSTVYHTESVPSTEIGPAYGISELTSTILFTGDQYVWARLINTSGLSGSWNTGAEDGKLLSGGPTVETGLINYIPVEMRGERIVTTKYTFYDISPGLWYDPIDPTDSTGLVNIINNDISKDGYMSCSVDITNVDAGSGTLYLEFQGIDGTLESYILPERGETAFTPTGTKTQILVEGIKIPIEAISTRMKLVLDTGSVTIDGVVFNTGLYAINSGSTQTDQLLNPNDSTTDLGSINDSENLLDGDVDGPIDNTATVDTSSGGGPYDDIPEVGGYYKWIDP